MNSDIIKRTGCLAVTAEWMDEVWIEGSVDVLTAIKARIALADAINAPVTTAVPRSFHALPVEHTARNSENQYEVTGWSFVDDDDPRKWATP